MRAHSGSCPSGTDGGGCCGKGESSLGWPVSPASAVNLARDRGTPFPPLHSSPLPLRLQLDGCSRASRRSAFVSPFFFPPYPIGRHPLPTRGVHTRGCCCNCSQASLSLVLSPPDFQPAHPASLAACTPLREYRRHSLKRIKLHVGYKILETEKHATIEFSVILMT